MKQNGIIVFGASGLLGSHVLAILQRSAAHQSVYPLGKTNVDFCQPEAVHTIIRSINPSVVINCAGMTDVDACESNTEVADAVNSRAVHEMALACNAVKSRLVHISTDFVFTGNEDEGPPYADTAAPKMFVGRDDAGVYAKTKYSAEAWAATCPNHCIIRTSWLFGNHPTGRRTFPEWFVDRTLAAILEMRAAEKSGAEYERAPMLTDRFGSPSYAPDVAQAVVMLAASPWVGFAHVVNGNPSDASNIEDAGKFGFTGSQEDFGSYAIKTFAQAQPVQTNLFGDIGRDFDKIYKRITQNDLLESGAWKVRRPVNTRLKPSILGGLSLRPFDQALLHFWKHRRVS